MLSDAVKTGLRDELARLSSESERIGRMIQAIELLLSADDAVRAEGAIHGVHRSPVSDFVSPRTSDGDENQKPFAQCIRDALAEVAEPMRPTDVLDVIMRNGYKPKQTNKPLLTLVASELWRMSKRGHIRKNPDGRYALKEAS
jgi:hypothetical protein